MKLIPNFIGTVYSESGSVGKNIPEMYFYCSLQDAVNMTKLRFSNAKVLVSARWFCLFELCDEKRRIFIGINLLIKINDDYRALFPVGATSFHVSYCK